MNIITYFVAELYFKDEPDESISGYIFKVGGFDEENATEEEKLADMNVFFYLQDEKDMEGLKDTENGEDFVVTSFDAYYD